MITLEKAEGNHENRCGIRLRIDKINVARDGIKRVSSICNSRNIDVLDVTVGV